MKPVPFVALLLIAIPLAAADAFYERRLESGKASLAAKQYVEAAAELRIASFGLLEEPKRLLETLALLSLAESSMGQYEGLEATLKRFVEIEARFDTWDGVVLDEEQRRQFETLLVRTIPKQILISVGTLAPLVEPKRQAPARAEVPRRIPPPPTAAPPTVPAPVLRPDPRTQTRTAEPEHPSGPEAIAESNKLIAARRYGDAVSVLSEAVGRDRSNRDLRLALMQAAAMAKDWPVAAAQVPLLNPFRDNEPVPMFYAAITLFETGQLTSARQMLSRALPRLTRSPIVEEYAVKINGTRSGS